MFQKRQFKYWRIVFRTAIRRYTDNDLSLSRAVPVISEISQIESVQGFDYSKWYNKTAKFPNEQSKVVYYVLKQGNRFQLVRKNISDGLIEIVSNICGCKQDVAVQINQAVWTFSDDLAEVEMPLPKMFENGKISDYAFTYFFKGLSRCPARKDTEYLMTTGKFNNYETL